MTTLEKEKNTLDLSFLLQLVKEQKVRIAELTRSKQEALSQCKVSTCQTILLRTLRQDFPALIQSL